MSQSPSTNQGMLSPYRVLDLTDEKAWLCGKLLGDLGADVIKVEPPAGDPGRKTGPFYGNSREPEKSLLWWAYNNSKRGITLDLESEQGRNTFLQLVSGADFLLESFAPGYLEKLGLGYTRLEAVNPGLILVSVTPFGQTGPYRDYKGPDIVGWAMGGYMYVFGDPDRPPLRIGNTAQAHLHAASEAAVGALVALQYRAITGKGQHVDVSIQEAVARLDMTTKYDMLGIPLKRGEWLNLRNVPITYIWHCKDGHVIWVYAYGPAAELGVKPFVQWVEEDGLRDTVISTTDWVGLGVVTDEDFDRLEKLAEAVKEPTVRFFMKHTKAELFEGAVKRNLMLYPVASAVDILKDPHLLERKSWVEINHPEIGKTIRYPGPVFRSTEAEPVTLRRAPLIGQHNREVLNEKRPVVSTRATGKPTRLPLEGIKIADFCWAYVGPITTKLLADFGAEVIKIEGRTRPDVERAAVPPFKDNIPGFNRDGHFNEVNTSKMSLAVNLAKPKGTELVKKLAAWADIVIDNFAGGAMQRMGLGYDVLRQINPRVIMMSSAMMGQSGPYLKLRGFGQHLTALTGFNQITGYEDRGPAFLGYYTDFISPHINQMALLGALEYRRRTGKGMYIDAAQIESCMHFLTPVLLDYAVNGTIASPMGNRHREAAPHGAYRCKGNDRWCVIAVFSDEEWKSFCRVSEHPELANDSRFRILAIRKQNEDELDSLVERWTLTCTPEEVMNLLQKAGVPAGIIQDSVDLYERDPQMKHRNFYQVLDHPEVGKHRAVAPAFRMSKTNFEVRRAPLLGEHNEYVMKNILHVPDDEIAELIVEGVLE
ncbi:MAG: CoA transferase [Dehalococcoidia bacterium]|nr:CoA transferase [Dehalococcoidia bacterium]